MFDILLILRIDVTSGKRIYNGAVLSQPFLDQSESFLEVMKTTSLHVRANSHHFSLKTRSRLSLYNIRYIVEI